MTDFEYRVRWRRKSRTVQVYDKPFGADRKVTEHQEPERTYSMIYQTEKAAREKVDRLVRMDEDKHTFENEDGSNQFDFPDLAAVPTIEARVVGEWKGK